MARSLNRVDLLGWLGGDAKIREFDDGTSVGEVSVATEHSRKNAAGEWLAESGRPWIGAAAFAAGWLAWYLAAGRR